MNALFFEFLNKIKKKNNCIWYNKIKWLTLENNTENLIKGLQTLVQDGGAQGVDFVVQMIMQLLYAMDAKICETYYMECKPMMG